MKFENCIMPSYAFHERRGKFTNEILSKIKEEQNMQILI